MPQDLRQGPSHDGNLTGRVVVITGASSGMGRASAIAFARAGARLALSDIDVAGLDATVAAIREVSDVDVLAERVDLCSVPAIQAHLEAIAARFGIIDTIYNNAGIMPVTLIEDTSEDDLDKVIAVNFKAPFFIVKYALPSLLKSEHPSIINVASVAALMPAREGTSAYAATKGAVVSLTRAQARDLASHGIRVNCLLPGPINTPLTEPAFDRFPAEERDEARNRAVSRNLIKRFGTPEEVVSVALFLASDQASYITGAMFTVDGGWSAC